MSTEINQPQPSIFGSGNNQMNLPNATPVLVLGIVSIVGCFCYGIVGVICGIIALILAKKDLALFNANPSGFTVSSFNNLKAGRICAIIGVIISGIYLTVVVVMLAIFGTVFLNNPNVFFHQMH